MRDLREININDGGQPVTRPAPTPEQIARFERRHGVTLPDEYVALLKHANGGHPELDTFWPAHLDGPWSVNDFYPLDDGREFSVDWHMVHWAPYIGERTVPIGRDGGDNQIFLDLNDPSAPVRLCIHDEDFRVIDVAPSFAEFIDLLHVNPDYR
jgi:hypothetical protein